MARLDRLIQAAATTHGVDKALQSVEAAMVNPAMAATSSKITSPIERKQYFN